MAAYPPSMTSNVAPAPYSISASTGGAGFTSAYLACDASGTTRWYNGASPTFPCSITVYMGPDDDISITSYVIASATDLNIYGPTDWDLMGFNGVAYEIIESRRGITWPLTPTGVEFFLTEPSKPYKYFRVSVISTGDLAYAPSIYNLRFIGDIYVPPPPAGIIIDDLRLETAPPPIQVQDFRILRYEAPILIDDFRIGSVPPPIQVQDFRVIAPPPPIEIYNFRLISPVPPIEIDDFRVISKPPPIQVQDFRVTTSIGIIIDGFILDALLPPIEIEDFRIFEFTPPTGIIIDGFRLKAHPPPIEIGDFRMAVATGVIIDDLRMGTVPPPIELDDFRVLEETKDPDGVLITNFRLKNKKIVDTVEKILPMAGFGVYDGQNIEVGSELVIPAMTSNTTPAPFIVSASTWYDGNYLPFKAFNKITGGDYISWITQNGVITGWLQIQLSTPAWFNSYELFGVHSGGTANSPRSWTISGSNNGVNYTILDTQTDVGDWVAQVGKTFTLNTKKNYLYYKFEGSSWGPNYLWISELYFFNNVSKQRVYTPDMINNTTPAGYVASYSGTSGPVAGYQAYSPYFDTGYNNGTGGAWWTLEFPEAFVCDQLIISGSADNGARVTNFYLRGSNDNSAWTILGNWGDILNGNPTQVLPIANSTYYRFYQIYVNSGAYGPYCSLSNIHFNGYKEIPFTGNELIEPYPQVVFDDKETTMWENIVSQFLTLKISAYSAISKYSITQSAPFMTSWALEASIDGTTYSEIDNRSNIEWKEGVPQEFEVVNSGVWKFFRIKILETTHSYPECTISEIKLFRKKNYKMYYESKDVVALHSYADGYTTKGVNNILAEGPIGKVYLDNYTNNTFISSKFEGDGNVTVKGDYRFPWYIADASDIRVESAFFPSDWPLFWNGADSVFNTSRIDLTPVMTSNTEPVGYIASANVANDPEAQAWNVFDSDRDTYWHPNTGHTFGWVQLQFPDPIRVRVFQITAPNTAEAGGPKTFLLEGSDDGLVWEQLFVGNAVEWNVGEIRTYTVLQNRASYLYIRLYITSGYFGTVNMFGVAQLSLFDTTVDSLDPIVDQYGNKATISGAVVVTSEPNYDGTSILNLANGAVQFKRELGFYRGRFSVEVKWSPKSDTPTANILYANQPVGTTLLCFSVAYVVDKISLYLSTNGTSWDLASSANYSSLYKVKEGEWYHIKLTFNGNTYALTVNDQVIFQVKSTAYLAPMKSIDLGNIDNSQSFYAFDLRFLPFVEPDDRTYKLPFYPILRFDTLLNLSYDLKDINILEPGEDQWTNNIKFLLGEVNVTPGGAPTPITYAYGGEFYLPYTDFEQIAEDGTFLKVNHNFGTIEWKQFLHAYPEATLPILEKYSPVPLDSIGMVSGGAVWGGIRIGKLYNRNFLGLKWPMTSSADYGAIYSGNATIATISTGPLQLNGMIRRNF